MNNVNSFDGQMFLFPLKMEDAFVINLHGHLKLKGDSNTMN